MTPQRAKELLPRVTKNLELMKAISEGKQIQYKTIDGWADYLPNHSNLHFELTDDPDARRIKPEKKWRPWKPEEVPVGAAMRRKDGHSWKRLIVTVTDSKVVMPHMGSLMEYTFSELLNEYEHSTDNGKTWQPCGVEE